MLLFLDQDSILWFLFRFWIDAGKAHKDERLESLSLKFMAQIAAHACAGTVQDTSMI